MQHHGCHCSMFLLKEGALLSLREFPHSKASTSWFVLKMTLPGETSCKKSSHSAVAAASHKQDTQLRSAKKKVRNALLSSLMIPLTLPLHCSNPAVSCTGATPHHQENTIPLPMDSLPPVLFHSPGNDLLH